MDDRYSDTHSCADHGVHACDHCSHDRHWGSVDLRARHCHSEMARQPSPQSGRKVGSDKQPYQQNADPSCQCCGSDWREGRTESTMTSYWAMYVFRQDTNLRPGRSRPLYSKDELALACCLWLMETNGSNSHFEAVGCTE